MSDHVLKTLDDLKREISSLETQLNEKKRMANYLSTELADGDEIYAIQSAKSVSGMPTNGDEYYGKPAVTAIRMVLQARRHANRGPATLAEIYDILIAGGYQFDAASEANAKSSLRVTLSKRSETFHKLPNGKYGLVKWYEKVKGGKKGNRKSSSIDDEEVGLDTMEEEFGDADIKEAEKVEK